MFEELGNTSIVNDQNFQVVNSDPVKDGFSRTVISEEILENKSSTNENSSTFSEETHSKPHWWSQEEQHDVILFSQSFPSLSSYETLKTCDVYIGFHGHKRSLHRFANWLRAELELLGISCFMADQRQWRKSPSRTMVEAAMNAATIGVIFVSRKTFSERQRINELRFFLRRKNLIPIFFNLDPEYCMARDIIEKRGDLWERHGGELWNLYGGSEREWKEVVDGIRRVDQCRLEAHTSNWRDCISKAIDILGIKLGRRSAFKKEQVTENEEFPFPRNDNFVGRKRELLELELILFGDVNGEGEKECIELKTSGKKKKYTEGECSRRNNSFKVKKEVYELNKQQTRKGKQPILWTESKSEIQLQNFNIPPRYHRFMRGKSGKSYSEGRCPLNVLYGKGVACVTGPSGIGKTELLLEFAYRFSQRYKKILWIDGESKYILHNYLSLLPILGIDMNLENQLSQGRDPSRKFEEYERECISRVRKELMRDIPFLIVIDNLEDEKEWWGGRNIMDFLPPFGRETHIIISTRLTRMLNLEPLELSYLSGAEAMCLMNQKQKNLLTKDVESLRIIEEKMGRLTLGLALVGAIISELPIYPSKLLHLINHAPLSDLTVTLKEESLLGRNTFLVQLLDVCFSLLEIENETRNLAKRMLWASGCFAPSSIPISLLSRAASVLSTNLRKGSSILNKCANFFTPCCLACHAKRSEEESVSALVRFGIFRINLRSDSVQVHEIIRLYGRKRGGSMEVAHAMVYAINSCGFHPAHYDHIWAACFLTFRFKKDQDTVFLDHHQLLNFIKRLVLPIGIQTFNSYQCNAALELLRLCTQALEDAEESLISAIEKTPDWTNRWLCDSIHRSSRLDYTLYHELATTRADLLEIRAKLMMRGKLYTEGEELCRTSISIREVILGSEHPKTVSARTTMDGLLQIQPTIPDI